MTKALAWHRPLMIFAAAMTALGVLSAIEYNADDRMLVGVPIWAKPLLFSISFAIYAVTLAWLISRLRRPRIARLARRTGTVIAVGSGLEMLAIVVQVLRGQQSHFNYTSPFNTALFAGMGVAAGVIFVATAVVGIAFLREAPTADRASTSAIRLGLLTTLAGMSVGFLMVIPRAAQHGALIRGAHSVGVADGGPSLPVVGWSTTGGDLRIAHFVGLHALQALPLLALALTLFPPAARLAERTRTRLVRVGAAGYLGVFALVLWQALRGQALTSPDAWTWGALAAVVLVVTAGTMLVLRSERSAHLDDDALGQRRTEPFDEAHEPVLQPVLVPQPGLDVP